MKRFIAHRIVVLQVLTLLCVLLPLAGGAYVAWNKHQWVQANLDNLEPRYARLQGLVDRSVDLQTLSVKVNAELVRRVYPSAQDVAMAGNDAQQRIRSLFAESQLDIISIQVLPAKDEGQFNRISINLRVEGDLAGIQAALDKLAGQTPLVLLDSMTLQTIGAVLPASVQRLGGQFNFSVFRVRS